MKLQLFRLREINNATIGMLFVDGIYFCDTLEDKIRTLKIKYETCIPEGDYQLTINYSNRFKKRMPLILDVPNFTGIRIHSGNTIQNTAGCILLGNAGLKDFLFESQVTFDNFFKKLDIALKTEKCFIDIYNSILVK